MSKPIEWKRYEYKRHESRLVIDCIAKSELYINLKDKNEEAEIALHDPAAIEALAAELTKAAAALRKSQQVTFGDLKPGEMFRMLNYPQGVWMKIWGNEATLISSDLAAHVMSAGTRQREDDDLPVISLRATWEEIKQ